MIRLEDVHKNFGAESVLRGVSLSVDEGEFLVLLGRSGSGKSTALRTINRLIEPDSGRVIIGGADAAGLAPEALRRRIGYVIQAGGLFPHWSVARNVAAVPGLLGWTRARTEARVAALLTLLELPPERFAAKKPASLSGGEQQRVGIARALAADPPILLMDEPFGALDPVTRGGLQRALRRIQREGGKTVVFVTHDLDEALLLADRIAVMEAGRIVQHGTPAEIVERPATAFVRALVGGPEYGLRLLGVHRVGERVVPGEAPGTPISVEATLREALAAMRACGADTLPVRSAEGKTAGVLRLADVLRP